MFNRSRIIRIYGAIAALSLTSPAMAAQCYCVAKTAEPVQKKSNEFDGWSADIAETPPNPSRADILAKNPIPKSVRIVWVVPSDVKYDQRTVDVLEKLGKNAQAFYKRQLGGKTFVLNDPVVEVIYGNKPAKWYSTSNPSDGSISADTPTFSIDNAKVALQGRLNDQTEGYKFLMFVSADGVSGGVSFWLPGGAPIGMLAKSALDCLLKEPADPYCEIVPTHELSHGFGLPHNDDPKSLMSTNSGGLDDTYFTAAEKEILDKQEEEGYIVVP